MIIHISGSDSVCSATERFRATYEGYSDDGLKNVDCCRAEILQKEENDLIVFDIREEILEEAMRIGYEHYMERQTSLFTAHIAAQAWLKLIDW